MPKKFNEKPDTQTHAGLMVKAKDTGRILLIQKGPEDKHEPNKGLWELPGGHVEIGEKPLQTAIREWEEEVGRKLPKGKLKDSWVQKTNEHEYHTFLYVIKREDKIKINPTSKKEDFENPDNPKRKPMDVAAWFIIDNLQKKKFVRDSVEGTDWNKVKKAEIPWYFREPPLDREVFQQKKYFNGSAAPYKDEYDIDDHVMFVKNWYNTNVPLRQNRPRFHEVKDMIERYNNIKKASSWLASTTGVIDSASDNPHTDEVGKSGWSRFLDTPGEDEMSYTIGDHMGKKKRKKKKNERNLSMLDGIDLKDDDDVEPRANIVRIWDTSGEFSGKMASSWAYRYADNDSDGSLEDLGGEGIAAIGLTNGMTPKDLKSDVTDVTASRISSWKTADIEGAQGTEGVGATFVGGPDGGATLLADQKPGLSPVEQYEGTRETGTKYKTGPEWKSFYTDDPLGEVASRKKISLVGQGFQTAQDAEPNAIKGDTGVLQSKGEVTAEEAQAGSPAITQGIPPGTGLDDKSVSWGNTRGSAVFFGMSDDQSIEDYDFNDYSDDL